MSAWVGWKCGVVVAGISLGLAMGCTEFPTGGPAGDADSTGDDDTADPCGEPAEAEPGPADDACTSTEPYE